MPSSVEVVVPYVLSALMALEYAYHLVRDRGSQTPRDAATSIMVAVPHTLLLTILPPAWMALYQALEHAMPWQLPLAWWTWPLGVLAIDLATYWMHRYHHALNVTWAIHSVHHSSEELTITTGARSSIMEPLVNVISGAYLILVVPALLGLPLEAAIAGWFIKVGWGVAVHTRCVDKLGPLEWVLATPSHHRVHHSLDPRCQGKNFGFVTIVWDKLFGTFQPEDARTAEAYGVPHPPSSYAPLTVAFHELSRVWRAAVATPRWWDKLRIWFMPAGWRPPGSRGEPATRARHSRPPAALHLVGGLQLAYFLAGSVQLTRTAPHHGLGADLAYLAFLLASTVVTGAYFEHSRHYARLETARALGVAGMLAATGAWFGRPLDALTVGMLALAGANLVAAWAYTLAQVRR
ncbi:MAG TPA: sterol desaturase family protein [Kofleriaceae bacterium]|jgi:sterol desaturase/sphingolipid hydroxylase (fatty acid hydroxylase superfamily)|nr:sterol desaturase family protein [Kofleriaceae bacterium]